MTGSNGKSDVSMAIDIGSDDYPKLLADFLATNPFHCVTFGKTVDIVNNPEKIPAFSEWMTGVVRASLSWDRGIVDEDKDDMATERGADK